ncbi:MAG: phosphoenolpyruvate carboxykinase domain-containing protein, partial [Spirochaetales bacterium]|nr:phosphoenolpyruvate carboxykinase domain-containing protein [Spirochaetales bacterium]
FTAKAELCPVICPDWEDPAGVPIDIFVFGGKRTSVMPLVHEAYDWEQGVYMGATASSEPTAAALDLGNVSLRFDPFAMTPFMGYNGGDYMQNWFDMGEKLGDKAPKIFYVNWFQKDGKRFIWPGFGENSRVLKWMCDRVEGKVEAIDTPIGRMPVDNGLTEGMDFPAEDWERLMKVDKDAFRKTVLEAEEYLSKFGDRLPKKMTEQLEKLKARLG